ncbi:LRRC4-like protein precursor [Saccoglossus kowalevskii]|uniref:LRRC4-like protein n=1 Tax=Saccoglossus kowalevskii TaxID=10224 RepID=D1LX58_SACKO|nr:LRRC4-like protein precursor [Saccoglossus kowalevskii]ACY92564.1 LRRC4-like protein [Saccoglossus kowalevskii]
MAVTMGTVLALFVLYLYQTGAVSYVNDSTYCHVESLRSCLCQLHEASLHIECHNASLRAIPSDVPNNTKTMYIEHDDIPVLGQSSFSDLRELRILDMPKNRVGRIDVGAFNGLVSLTQLNLVENNIADLEVGTFQGLPSLRSLELSKNRIRHIPVGLFLDLKELTHLHLEGNLISNFERGAFDGLINIESIMINRNSLSDVPTSALSTIPGDTLLTLFLHDNRIANVKKLAFNTDSLKNLEMLSLNNNAIASLDKAAFMGLSLFTMDLTGNQIQYLGKDVFKDLFREPFGDHLPTLTLNSNPLLCDCQMAPFLNWVNSTNVVINGKCFNPIHMRGTNLTEVTSSDLRCRVDLIRPPRNRTINIGFSDLVCCEIKSPQDNPKIRWFGPDGSYLVEDPCLLVNMTSEKESGFYTCVALGDGIYGETTIAISVPTPAPPKDTSTTPPAMNQHRTKTTITGSSVMTDQRMGNVTGTSTAPSSSAPRSSKGYNVLFIMFICVSVLLLIITLASITYCIRYRRRKKQKPRDTVMRSTSVMYSPMDGDTVHMNTVFNSKQKYTKIPAEL